MLPEQNKLLAELVARDEIESKLGDDNELSVNMEPKVVKVDHFDVFEENKRVLAELAAKDITFCGPYTTAIYLERLLEHGPKMDGSTKQEEIHAGELSLATGGFEVDNNIINPTQVEAKLAYNEKAAEILEAETQDEPDLVRIDKSWRQGLTPPCVILLNGHPGVGKLTTARALKDSFSIGTKSIIVSLPNT